MPRYRERVRVIGGVAEVPGELVGRGMIVGMTEPVPPPPPPEEMTVGTDVGRGIEPPPPPKMVVGIVVGMMVGVGDGVRVGVGVGLMTPVVAVRADATFDKDPYIALMFITPLNGTS